MGTYAAFVGLGKGKVENEFGSEGKRVAKCSKPLRNGPAKLAYSCENPLGNFTGCEILQCKNGFGM